MDWTSLPVKTETKERLEQLEEKDGRDWDTFIRRMVLDESIDADKQNPHSLPSIRLFETTEKIGSIEEAVSEVSEKTIVRPGEPNNPSTELDDWLDYHVEETHNAVTSETEYYHVVDYSDVPAEHNGLLLQHRLMSWLQSELNRRNYFVMMVNFEEQTFVIQHTDLIRRRLNRGV